MDPGQITGAQRDELMDQVKQQITLANIQELISVRFVIKVRL